MRHASPSALLRAAAAVAVAVVAGCSPDPSAPAPVAQPEPGGIVDRPAEAPPASTEARTRAALTETKFGAPLSPGAAVSLASIAADPAKFAGKQVKTEGVVKAVCKKAGCWMEIEADLPGDPGETGRAHVKMAGHSFYVPRNCDGHRAIVEGTVKAGAPEDTCASKDSCGGSENGAVARLEIAATGVEFVD